MIRSWLPVLLWAALMFAASTDAGSSVHTRRALAPLLRWFAPGIPAARIDRINLVLRKSAHVAEYTILAVLLWRPLARARRADGGWSWGAVSLAVGLAVVFAVSDEFHQAFVRSRTSSPRDVMIDAGGALFGMTLMGARHCLRRRESAR